MISPLQVDPLIISRPPFSSFHYHNRYQHYYQEPQNLSIWRFRSSSCTMYACNRISLVQVDRIIIVSASLDPLSPPLPPSISRVLGGLLTHNTHKLFVVIGGEERREGERRERERAGWCEPSLSRTHHTLTSQPLSLLDLISHWSLVVSLSLASPLSLAFSGGERAVDERAQTRSRSGIDRRESMRDEESAESERARQPGWSLLRAALHRPALNVFLPSNF